MIVPDKTFHKRINQAKKDILGKTDEQLLELAESFHDRIIMDFTTGVLSSPSREDQINDLASTLALWSVEQEISMSLANQPLHLVSVPKEFSPLANLPRDLCRVSPFHIMGKKDMGTRPFLRNFPIGEPDRWCQLFYTGPKLSIFDEDVFLALQALVDVAKYRQMTLWNDEKPSLAYWGPILPILSFMGNADTRNVKSYSRVFDSLELLAAATFKIVFYRPNEQGNLLPYEEEVTNMISRFRKVKKPGKGRVEIYVAINPFFYWRYMEKRSAYIDITERSILNSQTAKAIHRFMSSHKKDFWAGNMYTLATCINLNTQGCPRQLRKTIKAALAELANAGYLEPDSGFSTEIHDRVNLKRVAGVARKRRFLPKKVSGLLISD